MATTFFQRFCILLLSILCSAPAWADGRITHLSGEISVQRGGGITLPGTVGTKVGEGDVMITGANSYGRLEMTDGGEMVLRPNSQLKVESYRFHPEKPTDDNFVFNLLKGGLRTVTGLIGKRGNKDAYEGKTATATMGIRGTQFDMRFCHGDCGALADGTYIAVRFGAVHTGNALGSVDVAAGQVALVQQAKPPVMLPRDPGIGFTPPPVIPKLDEKKKVQAAAAATAEAAKPAEGKPAASSSDKASQSGTKDKQQGSDSKSDGKSESSESSSTKSKSGGSSSESGTEIKDNGGTDSGGKSNSDPGGKSGSSGSTSGSETTVTSNNASGSTSSGAGGGDSGSSTNQSSSAAPLLQAAPGMDCSVQ